MVLENGTCVVLEGSVKEKDSAVEKATEVILSFGPVVAGTPAGDFNVTKVRHNDGWIVTCAHPDVLNFVSPAEIDGGAEDGMSVGLLGRSKREADGRNSMSKCPEPSSMSGCIQYCCISDFHEK